MKVNKRNKLVCGVGINDADYPVHVCEMVDGKWKITWKCPFYIKWHAMMERCYSKSFILKHPSYIDCTSVPEWQRFSNFKAWMQTQDWERKHLDKDLLVFGNRLYGPDTCVFIESRLNLFLTDHKAKRGLYPIGVTFVQRPKRKPYRAKGVSVVTGKYEHLGCFSTPEEAHAAWLTFKLEQAHILAAEQPDERVAKALIKRYENYKDDRLNATIQL